VLAVVDDDSDDNRDGDKLQQLQLMMMGSSCRVTAVPVARPDTRPGWLPPRLADTAGRRVAGPCLGRDRVRHAALA